MKITKRFIFDVTMTPPDEPTYVVDATPVKVNTSFLLALAIQDCSAEILSEIPENMGAFVANVKLIGDLNGSQLSGIVTAILGSLYSRTSENETEEVKRHILYEIHSAYENFIKDVLKI